MASYTHLENHESFYVTLSFLAFVIILIVLIFCIIMTEVIVFDARKVEKHTLNAITRLEKLTQHNYYGKRRYKSLNYAKWKKIPKIHKKGSKQIILQQKKQIEILKIQRGITVEQVINLLFEAISTQPKYQNNTQNKLCILDDDSADGVVTTAEKALQDLSLRQNTLEWLIQTLSNFKPEMLKKLVTPGIFPSVTYEDILDRLKKLQDRDAAREKKIWVTPDEHGGVNKIFTRKSGETEDIILESLKSIEMTDEAMKITDTGESIMNLPEEMNCASSTISTKGIDVDQPEINASSDAELVNAEPVDVKLIDEKPTTVKLSAAKPCSTASLQETVESHAKSSDAVPVRSIDQKISIEKSIEIQFSDNLDVMPNQQLDIQ